jgi:PAS domain-containing protein
MSPEALLATVTALRERMQGAHRELDVAWEELQAEAALLARESRRYAEFFQFAPDAYAITDAGGTVLEVNHATLELLQAQTGDVVGQVLARYIGERAPRVELIARAIPLKKSDARGLCWLLRPS